MAAIEDIDFLWANCDEDAQIIYLDSERRDRHVFPHPNQYTIEFASPFKLVYGYDILDAMFPTTMFNVEGYNNKIVLGTIASTRRLWDMSDFDSAAFVNEFYATVPELIERIFDDTPGNLALARSDRMEMNGIDHVAKSSDTFVRQVIVSQIVQATTNDNAYPAYEVVIRDGKRWYIPEQTAADIDRDRSVFKMLDDNNATITYYQQRYVTEMGHGNMVQMMAYDILITVHNVLLPIQNYENTQIQMQINNFLNTVAMACSHTSAIPEQANRLTFSAQTPFFINMKASTCVTVLGFSELSEPFGKAGYYSAVHRSLDPDRRMFFSFRNAKNQRQEVTTPGLLNLGGVRFVIFRCPEIEAHAFSGKNMALAAGLGIFKMVAGTNGINNLRFDFSNFVQKPFHPIGKLSKMSIRFELTNGQLYDTKGIDHHVLISLKFLIPSVSKYAANTLHRYQIRELNDEYDPDVLKFLMNKRDLCEKQEEEQESSPMPPLADAAMRAIQSLVGLHTLPKKRYQ